MNIARNFLATVDRLPEKTFIVGADERSFSYAVMLSRARRFASFLAAHGVVSGDRIILSFPSTPDYLTAYLAVLLSDCTAVPVDSRSTPRHLEYVRAETKARLCIAPKERRDFGNAPGEVTFPDDLDRLPEAPMGRLVQGTNPLALIMFTSGATGLPKGVRLTHANLQHTVRSITTWAQVAESDRELTTLSLTHLFGLAHCHVYWTLGGTVLLETSLRDVPAVLQRVRREQISSFPGTPGGFKLIIDHFAEQFAADAASLKYIIVNSAPMEESYIRRVLALLPNTRFYMYYGLTEASRSSYICYNEHLDKLVSVGRPTPGADIAVGDPAKPFVNQAGEILIRGPHVTPGYWGMDSAPYFDGDWFRSGDLGVMDSDGFLTWTGRLREQINIDGLKLSPAEVEVVLREHLAVVDAAVVGVPDERTGERVVAFVVAKGETDKALETELRKHCKGRLEVYKVPSQVVFVDSIPRTDTGKVQRLRLRDRLVQ